MQSELTALKWTWSELGLFTSTILALFSLVLLPCLPKQHISRSMMNKYEEWLLSWSGTFARLSLCCSEERAIG